MSCLTPEQLAEFALRLDAERSPPEHLRSCHSCTAKLAELTQLSAQLSRVHVEVGRGHDRSRVELLTRLATETTGSAEAASIGTVPFPWRRSLWQRVAVGGLGLTAVAACLLMLLSFGPTEHASAMERMIAKLREVTSFEYSMTTENTFVRDEAEGMMKAVYQGTVRWQRAQSPDGKEMHAHSEEAIIYHYPANTPPSEREYRLVARVEVLLPAGEEGMLIDHIREYYNRIPVFDGDFGKDSPVTKLRMVKDREGEMLRELGNRTIDGRPVHGFVMRLKGAEKGDGYDALEVWVDSETDLPLEIKFELDRDSTKFRIYDCRWNVPIDPIVFTAGPPEGYVDATPPDDRATIDKMIAALALYAELSGGTYPSVEHFYGDEIQQQMLKMAGFNGESQEDWTDNETYQQLQQSAEGLDWLTRTLRRGHDTGYFGETVDANDKTKVLLWWVARPADSYGVIYGDLEYELVKERQEGEWDMYNMLREGKSPQEAMAETTKNTKRTEVKNSDLDQE